MAAERGAGRPGRPRAARDDELLRLLADAADAEVARAGARLADALADFDAATIATTHQFCQQVLIGLGVAGDSDTGATLVENLDELVVEVVDDLYLRGFARPGADEPPFTRADRAAARPRTPSATRRPELEPARRRAGSPADVRAPVRRRRSAPRSTGASGGSGCSATTTC